MTDTPAGLLAVSVYVGAVLLSLPAAAMVLLLTRRLEVRRAANVVGLVVVALVAVVAASVGTLADVAAGAWLGALAVAALVFLWSLPVLVGARLVARTTGLDGDDALGHAVAGLPAGLLASVAWFVTPGGLARYDFTSLSGPPPWLATAGLLLTVLVVPGLVGTGLHRLVGHRR